MSSKNLYVDHLALCGLMALSIARRDGIVSSYAQENLFLCLWQAIADKKRLFRRELASDIKWLLQEGREKGLRVDLPGKLEYLWRSSRGDLLDQNDLYRLQHIMHAIKLTVINYAVLTESEWAGKQGTKLSETVPSVYVRRADFEAGFDSAGIQIRKISTHITAKIQAVDELLTTVVWCRNSSEETTNLN